jgi:hypothetical protein
MPEDDPKGTVNVGNIHVDKAVVTNPRPKDERQAWLQMTPLLSVLITGIALITTSALQVWQTHTSALQKTDDDWRTALSKISDDQDPVVGSLEMETFLSVVKYRERAGTIIAVKVPKIADKEEFDAVFAVLPERTDKFNQLNLIAVARTITSNLQDQYVAIAKRLPEAQRASKTFADFVLAPESFPLEGKELDSILSETWKLDSTIHGLRTVWTRKSQTAPVSPENLDLSGIEFYGTGKGDDFTGISFKGADLSGSEFIGQCIVTDPDAQRFVHCTPPATN